MQSLTAAEKTNADIVLLQEIRDPAALQEIVKAIPEYSLDVVSDFRGNLEVVTFNPGEESGAGNAREGSEYKSL